LNLAAFRTSEVVLSLRGKKEGIPVDEVEHIDNEVMIDALDQLLIELKSQAEEDATLEGVVQLLVLLPLYRRWWFLLANRKKYLSRYLHRSKRTYRKGLLDTIRRSNGLDRMTEQGLIKSCNDGRYSEDFAKIIRLIIKSGKIQEYIDILPLIIARCESIRNMGDP